MLRSTLAQADSPVYGAAWGPNGDQLLFCAGQQLTVRSLHSNSKVISWKAHDNVVTKVDWSTANGQIVSGGEDCYYKVGLATYMIVILMNRP
jgi:intraflagellar transport protein 80